MSTTQVMQPSAASPGPQPQLTQGPMQPAHSMAMAPALGGRGSWPRVEGGSGAAA